MSHRSKLPTAAFGSLALLACGTLSLAAGNPASAPTPAKSPGPPAKTADAAPAPSNDHIQVQHILIGYKGSVPGKAITRTVEEARKLADELTARARKGEDFDTLVKQYTDDQFPGIYGMANTGVTPAQGEYLRSGMVPGFGDASFPLKVGEIGVSAYDAQKSQFGWHIVKRLK